MRAIYRAKDRTLLAIFVALNWIGVALGWVAFLFHLDDLNRAAELFGGNQLSTFWIYGAWLVPLLAGTLYAAVWTHVLNRFDGIDEFLEATFDHKDHKDYELVTEWHVNGQKHSEGFYKKKKKDGFWVYWHESGRKKAEGGLENGHQNGFWTYWHESGRKQAEGDLKNGQQDGSWVFWSQDGSINSEKSGIYKDDKKIAPLPKK